MCLVYLFCYYNISIWISLNLNIKRVPRWKFFSTLIWVMFIKFINGHNYGLCWFFYALRILWNKRLFHPSKVRFFRNSLINKCLWHCFTPLADWQLRAVIIGISPPPGCPPAARFARKYHYHRYLSSLSASSNLAAVHRNNPNIIPRFCGL